ncbi:MAG TPA: DegQ family serine endoprotease [Pyrinomonadaceae bacterium]|jgi:Do/DeqQ family serine protease
MKFYQLSSLKIFTVFATAALLAGCSGGNAQLSPNSQTSQTEQSAPVSQSPIVLADGIRASYADIVERVAPAVVNIDARRRTSRAPQQQQQQQQNPLLDDPRFRDFFDQLPQGQRQQPPPVERGVGSGVIISADGTILTNNHVVEGADDIEIELTDKRTFKAKVVGLDPASDLAVLKVEADNLPFMNLGDSDKVRVGDVVLAIGNPLGIGQTVTSGIISAKGRRTGLGTGSFENFLQTDAPINRGNSGGALINVTGELVGINSQILSPGGAAGGNIGIGFAIPSNMVKGVMEQLVKNGKVRRGQLGVLIRDIDSDLAASLNLKDTRGAVITDVQPDSAAAKAGLQRYDVVTALNGERVEDGNTLRNRIAATQPGSEVTLTVLREGKEQQIKATLGELSVQAAENERENPQGNQNAPGGEQSGRLGLGMQPLTPDLKRQLQVNAERGLVVTEVDPNGPAAEAGFREQDVILEINRQPVASFEDVQAALEKSGDRPVLILMERRGQVVFLTVRQRR